MPAIITHDFFGRDVYDRRHAQVGASRDQAQAFLLGNQGPDPFFYSVLDPALMHHHDLGSTMHRDNPAQLIAALARSLEVLDDDEAEVGHAYALGFLCHYTLDSTMHPFVYFQQYALCDAGVAGLTRKDGSEVHAVIESELDELVLFTARRQTIASFNPATQILRASDQVLMTASKMHAYLARAAYGRDVPGDMFARAVRCFRFTQHALYSPHGVKREALGAVEGLVRRHSLLHAMSHRPVEVTANHYDNHEGRPWQNPFTGEVRGAGFWDLYAQALDAACRNMEAFDEPGFDLACAHALTGGLNFSGDPSQGA